MLDVMNYVLVSIALGLNAYTGYIIDKGSKSLEEMEEVIKLNMIFKKTYLVKRTVGGYYLYIKEIDCCNKKKFKNLKQVKEYIIGENKWEA